MSYKAAAQPGSVRADLQRVCISWRALLSASVVAQLRAVFAVLDHPARGGADRLVRCLQPPSPAQSRDIGASGGEVCRKSKADDEQTNDITVTSALGHNVDEDVLMCLVAGGNETART
jgi:hypothetical protein